MESFIVRVYRRSRTTPGEIAGLVETVGTDQRRAFQSFAGLITVLQNAVLPMSDARDKVNNHADNDSYSTPGQKQAR